MKRRDFLQLMAATGMTASLPLSIKNAHAAPTVDRFFVMVNAGGGWDPTSLCDPKGLNQAYPDRAGSFNNYDGSVNTIELDDNKRIGQIQWSAIPNAFGETERLRIEGQYDNLFTTYGNRMVIANGVDTGTNNHATGNRNTWSGNLEMGYPSFAALYAGAMAPSLPMAFISNGGYDETAGLVARARANNANYLNELSDVNYQDDNNGYVYRTHDRSVDLYSKIEEAQAKRLERQRANETLPLRRKQLSQLFTVRGEENNLGAMRGFIDQLNDQLPRNTHMNNRNGGFKSQAQVATSAFAAGLGASVILSNGGYDTHGNHDTSHYRNMGDMLEGIDYLMKSLELLGLADKTTVVIGSDFGRTPYYNSGRGKDHWPVTSMVSIMPSGVNTGGKVFGKTNAQYRAVPVNTQTGQEDSDGVIITPAHVQKALRKYAGIDTSEAAQSFPLAVEDINLFG